MLETFRHLLRVLHLNNALGDNIIVLEVAGRVLYRREAMDFMGMECLLAISSRRPGTRSIPRNMLKRNRANMALALVALGRTGR